MSTPDEECILREHALEQIVEQIKKEFEKEGKTLPSDADLLKMAKDRHDNPRKEFRG